MDEALRGKALVEHGVRFCFVPGGTFTMGSLTGGDDERPCHRVTLPEFWISETSGSAAPTWGFGWCE